VGDGDDDQQVESCSEHRDERQQSVNKDAIGLRFPAGLVEESWKAELSAFSRLHPGVRRLSSGSFWTRALCYTTDASLFLSRHVSRAQVVVQ